MNSETWIPLTDYSTKYKVSVSTLRRRIKADDIKYRFQDGKYFLLDQPMGAHLRDHRPSQNSDASSMGAQVEATSVPGPQSTPAVTQQPLTQTAPQNSSQTPGESSSKKDLAEALLNKGQSVFNQHMIQQAVQQQNDQPILTAANKLLNELKKAYTLVLQEKEEQILQLKEEVSDLKTLVKVLEYENERLKPKNRPSL